MTLAPAARQIAGEGAHASRALYEHGLPRLEIAVLEQRIPRGQPLRREACGLSNDSPSGMATKPLWSPVKYFASTPSAAQRARTP